MKEKSILILGGSGFISGNFARFLLRMNYKVWVATRGIKVIPDGAISIVADRNQPTEYFAELSALDQKWDAVIDFTGINPHEFLGAMGFFGRSCEKYIFVSTDFVYNLGDRSNYTGLVGSYGYNKRVCEEIIQGESRLIAWTIIRLGHVYGPGAPLGCFPAHVRDAKLINQILQERQIHLVDGGVYYQQPMYVTDTCRMLAQMIISHQISYEVLDMGGPDCIRSIQYYEELASVLGKKLRCKAISRQDHLLQNPDDFPFFCDRIPRETNWLSYGISPPKISVNKGMEMYLLEEKN